MEVLQLPASTGKLLIPSDFNNAWELRRSLANSQNISLPTLNWILYLPSNFFFFAGKPSPGSLPWSMFFSALTRWVASRKHRKDGEWILSLFPVYMVGWSQSYCKTSPVSFCTKSEFGYTQSRAREVRATEKKSCSDYSFLCGWPQPAIKVKVFQDSMDSLLLLILFWLSRLLLSHFLPLYSGMSISPKLHFSGAKTFINYYVLRFTSR